MSNQLEGQPFPHTNWKLNEQENVKLCLIKI